MPTLRTPYARSLPVLLLCLAIGVPTAAVGGATGPAPGASAKASAKKKCKKKPKKCKKKKTPAQPQPVVTPTPVPLAPGVPAPDPPAPPPPVIQLSQIALTVTEGATDATTTVRLATQPASNITVSLVSSDPAAATVTPPVLTFTPANFATPQLITVGGTEDADAAAESATVTASSPGATSVTLAVSVTDNDFAGITVSPTSGVTVAEGGTDSSITIVLNAQPAADVTIPLGSSSVAKMTVSPTSVTFTAADWNVPQAVTLTGVQDPDLTNDVVFLRTFPATSADPDYSGFNAADPSVTVNDDDA